MSEIRLSGSFKLPINQKDCPYFLDAVFFLFSSLVTGPSFMSLSSLVLEL